jgi:hypothetical protein
VFLFWEVEGGSKEDLDRPAAGKGHQVYAFLEVAVADKELDRLQDESLLRPAK